MKSKGTNRKVVAIGSDHAGYWIKELLKGELQEMGYRALDMGTDSEKSCDYPDMAIKVADAVGKGRAFRGVLICGTGAGMAIVANKVPGVRAAVCNETYTAELTRAHNDANILTMGARVVGPGVAVRILSKFMDTPFEGDTPKGARHKNRLNKLGEIEREYMRAD